VSSFGEILKTMVDRVPGAIGAVFADWEGEPVDQFAHIEPIDIQLVGAHWGVVWSSCQAGLARLGAGGVDELWVEGQNALVFVQRVTPQYYVVLATKRSAHLQTARRALHACADTLLKEM
jgi:predicted regulator of Ras-like GTPase activity (Roadblock/LC7/MglB family)